MKPDDIEWRTGRVRFWDLDSIDEEQPLASQMQGLKEDLGQIEYPSGVLLDVGWYARGSEGGGFIVYVVRNEKWDEPLLKLRCATMVALREALLEGAAFAAEAATHNA